MNYEKNGNKIKSNYTLFIYLYTLKNGFKIGTKNKFKKFIYSIKKLSFILWKLFSPLLCVLIIQNIICYWSWNIVNFR